MLCHIVVWCPSGDFHLLFLSSLPMLWAGMCHSLIQGWSAAALVYLLGQWDLPAVTSGLSSRCWCLFRIMWVVSVLGILKRPWIRSQVSGAGPALPLAWGYRLISWVLICRRQHLAEVPPSSNSLGMCDSRGVNPLLCPCGRCWACHQPTSSRRPPGDTFFGESQVWLSFSCCSQWGFPAPEDTFDALHPIWCSSSGPTPKGRLCLEVSFRKVKRCWAMVPGAWWRWVGQSLGARSRQWRCTGAENDQVPAQKAYQQILKPQKIRTLPSPNSSPHLP